MSYCTRSSALAIKVSKENISANINKVETPQKVTANTRKRVNLILESPSPPKSSRSNSISPITERLSSKLRLSSPQADEGNKFRSARRALCDNSEFRLPGRDTEWDELTTYFKDLIDNGGSGSLYISGQPGTGKTATLSKIINTKEFQENIKIAFINCTSISSIGSIYKKICNELHLKVNSSATEKDHHMAIEKYLKSQPKKTTLLILDEIDQLCSLGKKQNVLYNIFEWPAIQRSKLILVGIANALDLTDRLLVRLNAKCELKPKVMHFGAYTKQQIVDILKSRLEECGDLFPPAAIQLLAAKVSAVSGDIRRALNIGKRVVELAENEKKKNSKILDMKQFDALIVDATPTEQKDPLPETDCKVQMKEVISVLNSVYGSGQTMASDVDDAFPLQQKILICTLLLIIKNDKNKDITIGRLHDVFKKVCKTRNIQAVDLSDFLSLCILLDTRGILRIVKKKETRFHRVKLQWDEDEVYTTLKDQQMVTNILNEKHLLNR